MLYNRNMTAATLPHVGCVHHCPSTVNVYRGTCASVCALKLGCYSSSSLPFATFLLLIRSLSFSFFLFLSLFSSEKTWHPQQRFDIGSKTRWISSLRDPFRMLALLNRPARTMPGASWILLRWVEQVAVTPLR